MALTERDVATPTFLEEGGSPPFENPAEVARVVLRDGSVVQIRQISPEDRESLRRHVERLSAESRFRRFLAPITDLSDRELRYFTEIDHRDHEALVATTADIGELVGVARYVRDSAEPASAEVALSVVDECQGRGIATALLHELVRRATAAGIDRFVAICRAENSDAIEVLEQLGETRPAPAGDPGLTELVIDLADPDERSRRLREALRHVADGKLSVLPRAPQE